MKEGERKGREGVWMKLRGKGEGRSGLGWLGEEGGGVVMTHDSTHDLLPRFMFRFIRSRYDGRK